jgi:LAO/AO transport system kinase
MIARDTPKRPDRNGVERLLEGDPRALGRALSVLEAGGRRADDLAGALRPHTGKAFVVGFSGPPGAGKSTLISAYVQELRARGEKVAVLAVDPSSPLSSGALLGDRVRMDLHVADEGVYVRSVASRGHLGGLALSIPFMLDAVDAAGWSTVILETVGVGQSETELVEFTDVKVVLSAPGLGDDVQALKAGLLEIADILVVNKSDLPFADATKNQLKSMLRLRSSERRIPDIVTTSAARHEGIDDLAQAIDRLRSSSVVAEDERKAARRLYGHLIRSIHAEFASRLACIDQGWMDHLLVNIRDGKSSVDEVVDELLNDCLRFGFPGAVENKRVQSDRARR